MIADGFEIVKAFSRDGYKLAVLKSPIDGKIHLFDQFACRKSTNIFDMALDDVKFLYNYYYNDIYLVITMNGKKGLYHTNINFLDGDPGLITEIEFDNIEKMSNVVVFTKNNKKYFSYVGEHDKISEKFDSITVDENNNHIIYCQKENETHIYNTVSQELLLISRSDEIKCVTKTGSAYNYYDGEYIFITKEDGKFGLISSKINSKIRKSNNGNAIIKQLLPPIYDEIEEQSNKFYLKKNNKTGLFIHSSYYTELIKPNYDKIEDLGGYFAFYTGEYCEIGSLNMYKSYTPLVTNCQIEKNTSDGIIYKKDGKYGLIIKNKDTVIPNEYDNISYILDYYYLLENDAKKGIMHCGEIIIPVDYDDIQIGGRYGNYERLSDADVLYFSLKKGEKFELARMHNFRTMTANVNLVGNYAFDKIEFFRDIMVLKDPSSTYIYDYEENLLKTFPAQSSVVLCPTNFRKSDGCTYLSYFYLIDESYFYYRNGKFEKVLTEENDCYVTTYEIDDETFELRTFDKNEHDAFCLKVEEKEDSEAKNLLMEVAEHGISKYPTLMLKRVKRKEQNSEKQ